MPKKIGHLAFQVYINIYTIYIYIPGIYLSSIFCVSTFVLWDPGMYALRQVTNMAQARLDFSIAPENWWERKLKFPFGNAYIQGRLLLVLRRVYIYIYIYTYL